MGGENVVEMDGRKASSSVQEGAEGVCHLGRGPGWGRAGTRPPGPQPTGTTVNK